MNSENASPTSVKQIPIISKKEWVYVGIILLLVLIITTMPYLYAYFSTPAEKQYMGIMLNVPDHAQYFSWMRELSDQPLASNKLTPERNQAIFHNLLWWMLGQTGRLLGWNYTVMFQVLRLVATSAFFVIAYRICAWFLTGNVKRMTAFLLTVFASGFGWVIIVAKYLFNLTDLPLETMLLVFIVEPNTFFSILTTPHLVAATLYIFVFELVLRGEVKGQLRYAVFAGLFALFLGLQHAYDLFLMYGILGAYGLLKTIRDRKIPLRLVWAGVIIGGISFWPGLYSALLTSLDPIWKAVLSQYGDAGVFTPNPLLLWILIGPTFFLAIFALIKMRFWKLGEKDDKAIFLVAWFWANFLLLYIPIDFQIKMLNGWQVPLAILTTIGLFHNIIPWIKNLAQRKHWKLNPGTIQITLITSVIIFTGLTNLYLWTWRFLDLGRHNYPYYLDKSEVEALKCLGRTGNQDEAALASVTIGQYLPALTGKYSFVSHWAQTVDYANKLDWSRQFFNQETDDAWRKQLVSEFHIDYIFYGPAEQIIGNYDPDLSNFLEPIGCTFGDVNIYRVRR